ncbi:PREDICTED: homeobox protein Meis3-like [Nicrophorus vespilloides]|uniref:Homeobox protein Meis3-like n=1 Tax=Nicrophorus vespilloides TaxID=110193 RepID=A0ABM1MXD9_NICVS|nr:PREDICTED: homeobox protein Meis3-like [Nicrophorus vespilloides]XP_017779239.1 PREDICTED: homeobox protein Meis3-like [Nicrophorus vespilloides]
MDSGVKNTKKTTTTTTTMLSVATGGDSVPQQPLAASVFPTTDSDQAQFEADKRAVYKHPLFPLLALLFERCELATQSSEPQSSDAFNLDIQAFVQHQERDRKPFLSNEPEIDGLMIKAIQVLRIHLLELEKVQELCKDFCNRYITCLKGKMQSENLLRSDYPQGPGQVMGMESNNNNSMMSHANSESSDSNSPVQYAISPSQPPVVPPQSSQIDVNTFNLHQYQQQQQQQQQQQTVAAAAAAAAAAVVAQQHVAPSAASCDNLVVHGSTPLSQIGANICAASESSGPLSPAPTTPGGSGDDCDSDFPMRRGRKQKRGVLPKHATSVMRSWLFQHLVHPYPTEDEKRHIAAQTNLTLLQVNNWFINARRRILQPMLDASAPPDNSSSTGSPSHKKKKGHNNNRRFWPQDFSTMPAHMDSSLLSSSDDEGDSYSSDGDESNLVIDAQAPTHENQNGHQVDALAFSGSPDSK